MFQSPTDVNRFYDIEGDVSMQLAPWAARNRGLDWTVAWHILQNPLRFRSDIAGGTIFLHAGQISDLATIPRPTWSFFLKPDDPRICLGAWFHDDQYRRRGKIILECGRTVQLTRKQCDEILAFEAMPELYASRAEQHAVYQALRRAGHRWPGEAWYERYKW